MVQKTTCRLCLFQTAVSMLISKGLSATRMVAKTRSNEKLTTIRKEFKKKWPEMEAKIPRFLGDIDPKPSSLRGLKSDSLNQSFH